MGSSMSSYPVSLLAYFRNAFSKKRRSEEEDMTGGPTSCKQRRLSHFTMSSSGGSGSGSGRCGFPFTKGSVRKNKHADKLVPAAPTTSQSSFAQSLYPFTNGNHTNNHAKIGVPAGAKSPPPQLLPARSRFSRVPPSLLPINEAQLASGSTSSYGLNGVATRVASSVAASGAMRNRLMCSTPKWTGSTTAGSSTGVPGDMSLRRSVMADTNATLDYSAINGTIAADCQHSVRPRVDAGATRAIMALSSIPTNRAAENIDFTKYAELLRNLKVGDREIYTNPVTGQKNVDIKNTLIDLCAEDVTALGDNRTSELNFQSLRINDQPSLPPINSIEATLQSTPEYQANYVESVTNRYTTIRQSRAQQIQQAKEEAQQSHNATLKMEQCFRKRLTGDWLIPTVPIVTLNDEPDADEPELNEFPAFDGDQSAVINNAMRRGAENEALITKFNITIRRADIQTLAGLNWLNDEVINFYMNLLMDRSEQRSADGLPKVYAFNTFFLSRLSASGHAGVRRWTRKVDIFAYDLIPVPVHVGGVHWCMAIIDFRNRTIRYYDSMISKNPNVLQMLANYLVEECRDKKGTAYDISDWSLESMIDIPRQNNQSDCGVFSCAFAETLTRAAPVRFSQQNMPWMRMKMVLEICRGELIL